MSVYDLIEYEEFEEAIEAINGGADVNEKNRRGRSLHYAAASSGRLDIIKLLIEKGLPLSLGEEEDAFIWNAAAGSGNLELVKFILENGQRDLNDGLRAASLDAHLDLIKYFVEEKDVDVNFSKSIIVKGMTEIETMREQPLSAVCMGSTYGKYEEENSLDDPDILDRVIKSMRFLLENGAQINAHGRFGNTALHFAAKDSHIKLAEFLLENGADINAKNDDGETPLTYADKKDTKVKALIKAFK